MLMVSEIAQRMIFGGCVSAALRIFFKKAESIFYESLEVLSEVSNNFKNFGV